MEHQSILLATIFVLAIALLEGCTKTTDVTTVAPTNTGQIAGSVQLLQMDGVRAASSTGVKVDILESNYQTTTDSTGKYVLDGIPAGYYDLHFSKPGFTESITEPLAFVGGGTLYYATTYLYQINNWKTTLSQPDTALESIEYGGGAADTLIDTMFYLKGAPGSVNASILDSTGKPLTSTIPVLAFFAGRNPNVNYLDSSTYFTWTYNNQYNSSPVDYWPVSFNSRQIPSDTVYVIAYPISGGIPAFSYEIGDTTKNVFTGFGPPSNTVKIVLP